jgi:hypothetical protein
MTPQLAGAPARSALRPATPVLRRIPVPVTEPPYDDELGPVETAPPEADAPWRRGTGAGAPRLAIQGTLALAFPAPAFPAPAFPGPAPVPAPAPPTTRPPLRLVPALPAPVPGGDDADGDIDPPWRRTPTRELPPARQWAGQLLQAVLEVLAGSRPPSQIRRFTAERVYIDLMTKASGCRSARRPTARHPGRTTVRSVHVTAPTDGVAEACAVISSGARYAAVALRLEGRNGRWQCTALRIG